MLMHGRVAPGSGTMRFRIRSLSHHREAMRVGDGVLALRLALVLALISLLGALSTLVFAAPPDPTWLTGIYDAADADDVVWILTEASVADQCAGPVLAPPWPRLTRLAPFVATSGNAPADSTGRPRPPPSA